MPQRTQIKRIIELGVAQVNLNAVDTGLALAALAQENTRNRIAAAAIGATADASGGTADPNYTLGAIVTPTTGTVNGADTFADKTGFDAAITSLNGSHATIRDAVNAVLAAIQGGAAYGRQVQDPGVAAAAIAAITPLAGATAGAVDSATAIQQLVTARNNQASLAGAINYCRVASGLEPLRDGSGGKFTKSITAYPMALQDATGAGLTGSGTSLSLEGTNLALTAIADNIASMVAAVNEVASAPDIGPFVVATHNPHTRWPVGNTTP